MFATKAVLDELLCDDWAADHVPVRADFATLYPEELERKVLAGWTTLYGFQALS